MFKDDFFEEFTITYGLREIIFLLKVLEIILRNSNEKILDEYSTHLTI